MKNLIYIFILIKSCILIAQENQGFFLDDWQPKTSTIPDYVDAEKPSDAATTTITINYADTVTKVCKYVYGNNANTWSGKMYTNGKLVENIKNMNPHVLRSSGCDIIMAAQLIGKSVMKITATGRLVMKLIQV